MLLEKDISISWLFFMQTKYVDALKNKRCIVNVYGNNVYICGYSLCKKGDLPIKIRIVGNK